MLKGSKVRKKLGVGLSALLERDERNNEVVVRRAGRYSSAAIHATLFPADTPPVRTTEQFKKGIREQVRKRHARG